MVQRRPIRSAVGVIAAAVLLAGTVTACSAGGADGAVEISYSVNNDETSISGAEKIIAAFEEKYPDITVKLDSHPAGTEGDNLTKTKLATGEMQDVFIYNTGSLLQVLRPDDTLVDLSDEPFMDKVTDDFKRTVNGDNGIYGAPIGGTGAGGILYNKKIYAELGLEVPQSWDEFMENNRVIQAEMPDVTPIIQAYGDDWTAQLWLLSDFANVDRADPEWADNYTANKAKYSDEPAFAGFAHQEEAYKAGFFNEDILSINNDQALKLIADGAGAHYPGLTFSAGAIAQNSPDTLNDVGYFAMPADDPEYTGATMWQPSAVYIPKTTEGAKLEAAKKFVDFIVQSPEACAIANETGVPSGPYASTACELKGDVPAMVIDLQAYLDDSRTAPALEFLSPVKGPNLPAITVQVGTGITGAKEAAALYDDDVKKQAQQLNLPGW